MYLKVAEYVLSYNEDVKKRGGGKKEEWCKKKCGNREKKREVGRSRKCGRGRKGEGEKGRKPRRVK